MSVVVGKVFIDGKAQPEGNAGIFEIKIVGNVEHIEVGRGNVSTEGKVTGDIKCGGSSNILGNVSGDVDAGGSVYV